MCFYQENQYKIKKDRKKVMETETWDKLAL